MDDCCVDKASAFEQLRERQATTLRLVLMATRAELRRSQACS